jgi:hypothetical protein
MVLLHLSCDIISYGTILAKLEAEQNNHENTNTQVHDSRLEIGEK